MASSRSWKSYRFTYRAREMQALADWVWAGQSGSVIGLAGAGKSNVLGFLCHRPEVFQSYLPPQADPVALIPIDLNNLPSNRLATFYRVILRSFYEVRDRFDQPLQQTVADLYLENRATRDPFLAQSALRELLLQFQVQQMKVVLVMDRFDKFGQTATSQMLDTLRGLRDSFKDILCYIVGMRQEMIYLFDPTALGEMYEILDTHVCWVGPMGDTDARRLIAEETLTIPTPLDEAGTAHILALTGGYPALLKAACHWWLSVPDSPPTAEWTAVLLAERSIQSRMEEIWTGLTQEERRALSEVQMRRAADVGGQHSYALSGLAAKGLVQRTDAGWRVFADLFAAYVADAEGQSGGKIWLDETTDELYQGQTVLGDLSPLERAVLHFLVQHSRIRHTKTDLIVNTWPDELRRQGVTDDSLYQVIRELRKRIEPNPAKPCYIVTWRGRPEGGYQFFPEGRPG
ncbi:MAG: winged helix-turn-helix domain-containing protein [Chloroflexi bacterium]|nr:winged helix-turn-helix domain-containing protein [Chloroflexota bacterium]